MKNSAFLIITAISLLSAGCRLAGIKGNGHIMTEDRTVPAFTEIEAAGAFKIEWQSGPPHLSITTDQNLLSYIEVRSVGTRLSIRTREQLRPTHSVKVSLSSSMLNGANLAGAVRLDAKQMSGEKFYFECSGASKIELEGKVDRLLADMTGAAKLKAGSLQTKTAEISTTGAASAEVFVTETLKVSITGAGKVTYAGNPKTVEKNVTGAGTIHKKE